MPQNTGTLRSFPVSHYVNMMFKILDILYEDDKFFLGTGISAKVYVVFVVIF